MSTHVFIHSTSTFFNAARRRYAQLCSTYMGSIPEDSIAAIYDTLPKCASISKCAGGISLNVSCFRAVGSPISGTTWQSLGLMPMLKNFDALNNYVKQGMKVGLLNLLNLHL